MGTWIHGFYGDIGQTDITKEELLAILNGLKIAWERNLDNVLCVLDSMHALSIFNTFFHLPFISFISNEVLRFRMYRLLCFIMGLGFRV